MFYLFYTQNVARKIGVRGIIYLYPPSPIIIPKVLLYSEEDGGYPLMQTIDNSLLALCLGFAIFALITGILVLKNLRNRTS